MKTTTIRKIALSQLAMSPRNVRTVQPSQAEDAMLEASIAAHGLEQNIGVEAAADNLFLVVYGGRRYRALASLCAKGVIDGDHKVPCRIMDEDEAFEASIAENVARVAMHPADEFDAFAKLIENGASERDVADRFGVALTHVQKRMKLAKVSPQILDRYRQGDMTLETLTAFTLSPCHERQTEVLARVEHMLNSTWNDTPGTIRRMLTDTSVQADGRLGRFVGVEAYEAAGGKVTRDLFSTSATCYLDDALLLERLAQEKLAEEAAKLEAEWRWALPMLDMSWSHAQSFARIYPDAIPAKDDQELSDELAKIEARIDEIEDREDENDADVEEYEALYARKEEIDAVIGQPTYVFSDEARAIAGVILTLDHAGNLKAEAGLVRPEDVPEEEPKPEPTTAEGGDPVDDADAGSTADQDDVGIEPRVDASPLKIVPAQHGETVKASRLTQVTDWLGSAFEGVIAFDEAHAMANAGGGKSDRGEVKPSQQGKAGLLLQDAAPGARVVYVSATGATEVGNLAYASRLGLWMTGDFPFSTRADFVASMEAGGIAAMEVISRDLKALGLYTARSVSYEGVEYEMLVHELTPAQIGIYDSYADAFQVIHSHLDKAMEAAGITSGEGTMNAQAKSAARSAFESNKQRFFQHLICAMKCPSLIKAIEGDIEAGHSSVIQVVSTSEALMERRLAEIPASEWGDLTVDVTPREYVLDYLAHSFPTQLFEPYTDEDGNLRSKPVMDEDGNPVFCREAEEARDAMIEHLGSLAPVQSALDQLIWHFGTDLVAEVTGRSRRVVKTADGKLKVANRPASSNLSETSAFQNDDKRVLIFSDAGGTGRSYHADLAAKNQRLRVHYLLEPGWRADNAIQGLGRTHRTNQAQPPLFRPCATNVKGEKRFLSTIARRLDTLGAITRGQRQTGGQGMFRAEDNLESSYAKLALRRFFAALYMGGIKACSLSRFEEMTGLDLLDSDGTLKDELPPISRFLNRCLALRIDMQNAVFSDFTEILDGIVEAAIAGGTFDAGLETLTATSFKIVERTDIFEAASGAKTTALTVEETQRNRPLTLDAVREMARGVSDARLLVNEQSGRAAIEMPTSGIMNDDGGIIERVRLYRPMAREAMTLLEMSGTHWKPVTDEAFEAAWNAEIATIPEFSTSRITIVSGLLLPIWDRLPEENMRVYRLQTDEGERIIGRLVTVDQLSSVYAKLGLDCTVTLTAEEAHTAVMDRAKTITVGHQLTLRRSRVMDAARMEVLGFEPETLKVLKSLGCKTEIISWKTRAFVPLMDLTVLTALLDQFQHPANPERIAA